ncbi:uncharacterized protein BKA55DRAFT_377378 [Fusarium redolens]|uniref:Uncharacterized protein n=1 Tax=Fusarium redolens TaxID=48865 RepID=A0A9P9H4G8_FUSRE|nr:uncharacterized protein BKA55DRAFT_377378 [Fusarium redolens]KAH7250307.1 hypothetical protein BKA55DRAFT_377378 [Fusarium redolens]
MINIISGAFCPHFHAFVHVSSVRHRLHPNAHTPNYSQPCKTSNPTSLPSAETNSGLPGTPGTI